MVGFSRSTVGLWRCDRIFLEVLRFVTGRHCLFSLEVKKVRARCSLPTVVKTRLDSTTGFRLVKCKSTNFALVFLSKRNNAAKLAIALRSNSSKVNSRMSSCNRHQDCFQMQIVLMEPESPNFRTSSTVVLCLHKVLNADLPEPTANQQTMVLSLVRKKATNSRKLSAIQRVHGFRR